jgi:hypothetical protein
MTAQIIEATDAFRSRAAAVTLIEGLAEAQLSDTARNRRKRAERKEAWRRAAAAVMFHDEHANFLIALAVAQRYGLAEAMKIPKQSEQSHCAPRERYREAVATLLRLPAPDQAAINWKRSRLRQEPYWGLCDVPHEEVEKAIADDEAFLAAHPIKKVKKADSLEPGPKPRVR